MKILVTFDTSIGLDPIEKQLSPNQTLENLQVLISLNYAQMDTCKITYNNISFKNKQTKLKDILPYVQTKQSQPEQTYTVKVVKKGQFDQIIDFANKLKNYGQANPIVSAGVIVFILFVLLFLLGSASQQQQFN